MAQIYTVYLNAGTKTQTYNDFARLSSRERQPLRKQYRHLLFFYNGSTGSIIFGSENDDPPPSQPCKNMFFSSSCDTRLTSHDCLVITAMYFPLSTFHGHPVTAFLSWQFNHVLFYPALTCQPSSGCPVLFWLYRPEYPVLP